MNTKAITLALLIAGFAMYMVWQYIEDQKNADNGSDEINVEINESLLEDGVSLKTEEAVSEEAEVETSPENESPEQSRT